MTDTYREALCAKRIEELRKMVTPKKVVPVEHSKTLEELAAEAATIEIPVSDELLANIAERDARLKGE